MALQSGIKVFGELGHVLVTTLVDARHVLLVFASIRALFQPFLNREIS